MFNNIIYKEKTGRQLITAGIATVLGLFLIFVINSLAGISFNKDIDFELLGNIGMFIWGIAGTLLIGGGIILIFGKLSQNNENASIQNESLRNIELKLDDLSENLREIARERIFMEQIKILKECVRNSSGHLDYNSVKYQQLHGYEYFYHAIKKLKYDFAEKSKTNREILYIIFQAVENGNITEKQLEELKAFTLSIYEKFAKEQKSVLSCYMATVRSLLIYISERIADPEKKAYYLKLLSAQLSDEELGLIFYNELNNVNSGLSFYQMLDSSNFFSEIKEEGLIHPGIQHKFYPNTRFSFLTGKS